MNRERPTPKEIFEGIDTDTLVDKAFTENPETDSMEMSAIANNIRHKLLEHVRETFDQAEEEIDRLPYHDIGHTEKVIAKVDGVMQAMQQGGVNISERDITIAKIAAAGHDTVQEWEENSQEGKVMRKRAIGQNEKDSAEYICSLLDEVNKKSGNDLFKQEDKEIIRQAIEATVPEFDPELKTVVQPNLSNESPPAVRALALADIGEAGTDPEGYCRGGDALFREENLDILQSNFADLTDKQKEAFKERMLDWSNSQAMFAKGRQARFETEIDGLPEAAKKNLREMFSKFDESIAAAESSAEKRKLMSFEALSKNMGYKEK